MSEHDNSFPPDHFPDDESPQPIPRSGMGIADQVLASEIGSHASGAAVADSATATADEPDGELSPLDPTLPDLATIPELAPLAVAASDIIPSAVDSDSGGLPPNGQFPYPDEDADEEAKDDGPPQATQDLFSHLGELRNRILYSVYAIIAASFVTWNYGQEISEWFARPIREVLRKHGVQFKLVTLDPTEGFQVYLQITLVAAILLVMPFILYQMWRFLEPALTSTERKFSVILLPFSIVLFFSGCALGYFMSPLFFEFFLMFQPPGTDATFAYGTSIVLLAKMILVFGVCFQVPIVTIFLNKIGLVSRNFLIDYWRHAVVVIFLIVAVITPTWDPLSLAICAVPPCLLYGVSIWMVKWL